jgi:hypothetical protein
MRRSTLFAAAFIAASASALGADSRAQLVGRWRSENMPVGYWVIDRYGDGRLAKKEYVRDYSDKPAEIIVTWGRWRLRGHTYSEFFQGATSASARAYVGKWWKVSVQRITAQRFEHLSNDGHPTFEARIGDRRPLLEIQQPPPKEYNWDKIIDTVSPSRHAIPSWVNSVPESPSIFTAIQARSRRRSLISVSLNVQCPRLAT